MRRERKWFTAAETDPLETEFGIRPEWIRSTTKILRKSELSNLPDITFISIAKTEVTSVERRSPSEELSLDQRFVSRGKNFLRK